MMNKMVINRCHLTIGYLYFNRQIPGTGAYAPPFKKNHKTKYLLCRIICFYTINSKCQYVYLTFYLYDYQIIDKVNTI